MDLVQSNNAIPDAPIDAPCTDEEYEAMRTKTIRFFGQSLP